MDAAAAHALLVNASLDRQGVASFGRQGGNVSQNVLPVAQLLFSVPRFSLTVGIIGFGFEAHAILRLLEYKFSLNSLSYQHIGWKLVFGNLQTMGEFVLRRLIGTTGWGGKAIYSIVADSMYCILARNFKVLNMEQPQFLPLFGNEETDDFLLWLAIYVCKTEEVADTPLRDHTITQRLKSLLLKIPYARRVLGDDATLTMPRLWRMFMGSCILVYGEKDANTQRQLAAVAVLQEKNKTEIKRQLDIQSIGYNDIQAANDKMKKTIGQLAEMRQSVQGNAGASVAAIFQTLHA